MRLAWPIVLRLLTWLGFSSITYVGLSGLISTMLSSWSSHLAGFPTVAIQILGLCKVDVALSFILSGYAFKLAKDGIGMGGAVKKLVRRGK